MLRKTPCARLELMKKMLLKILIIFLLLPLTFIFSRTSVNAQCPAGECCGTTGLECNVAENNCNSPLVPWAHENVNQCLCDCVECTNNSHCPTGYACQQHVCQAPTPTPQPTPTPEPGGCIEQENSFTPCPSGYPYGCTDGVHYFWCCVDAAHCKPPTITPSPPPGPGGGEGGSIRTAIGDIDPRNLQGFIQQLLNLALGVAGGIAFLLMLFGAFQIMTSSGNPEKMKSGSELITSALAGLLFIIFSIFLLKLIGVDILQIPGFGQ